jgi:outer membrane protein assembly factor BamB
MYLRISLVVAVAVILAPIANGQNVPQFRGEGGLGVAAKEAAISADWSQETSLQWKAEVEGSGWSQPVIWGDKVFLTTAIAANGSKPVDMANGARNPASMGMGAKRPDYNVEWKLVCLDANSGKTNWSKSIVTAQPKFGIHPSNSFATETPAADKDGIYAYFGSPGIVVGFDHDGNERWKKEVGSFKTGNDFGTGSSIAINDGRIYVQVLTEESSDIHCLATNDGETVWKNERNPSHKTSWSTPFIWKNNMRTELIVSGGMEVNSYDPKSGEPFWSVKKVKAATACSIFGDEQHIYFGGSDPMSKGPLFAVGAGGKGEIEPKRNNQIFESCAWRVPRSGPGMSTPVSNGEYVFQVDRSIAKLISVKDGAEIYKTRVQGMGLIVGCATVVGDEVFLVDEKGAMGAVKLGSEFEFRNLGSIGEVVWSTPAVTNDSIYVRSVNGLYKFKM